VYNQKLLIKLYYTDKVIKYDGALDILNLTLFDIYIKHTLTDLWISLDYIIGS